MRTRYIFFAFALLAGIATGVLFMSPNPKLSAQPTAQNTEANYSITTPRGNEPQILGTTTTATAEILPRPLLLMPIQGGLSRVTKKPFGLYVSPSTSPVSGDIFTGYHTGIDFETLPEEQNTNVSITAACQGQVLLKAWAKGYGGVFAQSCKLNGEDVTVIYGHLKLESITPELGQTLTSGDFIGYLGQAQSPETDGRRKHLHFDIHKGIEMNIHGYVGKQDELTNWLDPIKYLQ